MDQKYFEKQTATNKIKQSSVFIEFEGSLPYKQNISIRTYPEELNSET
jgi:hypothetical protein